MATDVEALQNRIYRLEQKLRDQELLTRNLASRDAPQPFINPPKLIKLDAQTWRTNTDITGRKLSHTLTPLDQPAVTVTAAATSGYFFADQVVAAIKRGRKYFIVSAGEFFCRGQLLGNLGIGGSAEMQVSTDPPTTGVTVTVHHAFGTGASEEGDAALAGTHIGADWNDREQVWNSTLQQCHIPVLEEE